jgi:hypothetical protein
MIVYTGIAGKTLLYLRGMEEEEWDQEHLIWNSTLYGTTVALDVFTLVDTFFLGDSPAGNDRLSRAKAYLKEKGKLAASVVGAGLLGIRIHAWVTHRSHQSDFYQMRDVLNAVSLMFSFVDTQMFLGNPTGKKLAPYMIAGETIVKVAASAMQMAAIQTEHNHD